MSEGLSAKAAAFFEYLSAVVDLDRVVRGYSTPEDDILPDGSREISLFPYVADGIEHVIDQEIELQLERQRTIDRRRDLLYRQVLSIAFPETMDTLREMGFYAHDVRGRESYRRDAAQSEMRAMMGDAAYEHLDYAIGRAESILDKLEEIAEKETTCAIKRLPGGMLLGGWPESRHLIEDLKLDSDMHSVMGAMSTFVDNVHYYLAKLYEIPVKKKGDDRKVVRDALEDMDLKELHVVVKKSFLTDPAMQELNHMRNTGLHSIPDYEFFIPTSGGKNVLRFLVSLKSKEGVRVESVYDYVSKTYDFLSGALASVLRVSLNTKSLPYKEAKRIQDEKKAQEKVEKDRKKKEEEERKQKEVAERQAAAREKKKRRRAARRKKEQEVQGAQQPQEPQTTEELPV